MAERRWTSAMRVAWQYTLSGAEQGLTATNALGQYRGGGGKIRDSDWYSLYKDAFGMAGKRESIEKIPSTYVIPDSMATESGFDWYQKYVMQYDVTGRHPETGIRSTRTVTVENDELLTKKEWQLAANDAIEDDPGSEPIEIESFSNYHFYRRTR